MTVEEICFPLTTIHAKLTPVSVDDISLSHLKSIGQVYMLTESSNRMAERLQQALTLRKS